MFPLPFSVPECRVFSEQVNRRLKRWRKFLSCPLWASLGAVEGRNRFHHTLNAVLVLSINVCIE